MMENSSNWKGSQNQKWFFQFDEKHFFPFPLPKIHLNMAGKFVKSNELQNDKRLLQFDENSFNIFFSVATKLF